MKVHLGQSTISDKINSSAPAKHAKIYDLFEVFFYYIEPVTFSAIPARVPLLRTREVDKWIKQLRGKVVKYLNLAIN